MLQTCLKLADSDDVVVALKALEAGDFVTDLNVSVTQRVPRGHKVAITKISAGEPVKKYGQIIGVASEVINPGDWVHDHNLTIEGVELRDEADDDAVVQHDFTGLPQTFWGYPRENGAVGTRNYIALLSTVNCSATVCRAVVDHFRASDILEQYENIDGVIAFTHGFGCAIDPKGFGMDVLQRALIGSATNPNVGAVLAIGLGCETNQAHFMMARAGIKPDDRFQSFTIQEEGGTRRSIDRAIAHIEQLLPEVNKTKRVETPVNKLRLALQCGGSDAYSGITANPALGRASDILVAAGGTAILSETPEIYGAEHILARRATHKDVSEKLMGQIAWWREYTSIFGASMDNNPSYGNKMGGLSTIYEKSLGAVAKGGSSPLVGVYGYGEPVKEGGLVFVDTPGYDPLCSSGQIASGATIMCFTTGRGSVSGFKPVPTLKLATNSQMFAHMEEDMDIDCGQVLSTKSLDEMGREIYRLIIETASGKVTKSEAAGFGDNEFVPWQLGPIL